MMGDYLVNLIVRHTGAVDRLEPRVATAFEPSNGLEIPERAALSTLRSAHSLDKDMPVDSTDAMRRHPATDRHSLAEPERRRAAMPEDRPRRVEPEAGLGAAIPEKPGQHSSLPAAATQPRPEPVAQGVDSGVKNPEPPSLLSQQDDQPGRHNRDTQMLGALPEHVVTPRAHVPPAGTSIEEVRVTLTSDRSAGAGQPVGQPAAVHVSATMGERVPSVPLRGEHGSSKLAARPHVAAVSARSGSSREMPIGAPAPHRSIEDLDEARQPVPSASRSTVGAVATVRQQSQDTSRDVSSLPEPATIHVTIERLEVRATPAATASRPQALKPASTSLDDYLRRRAEGARR